jgi:glucose 1-dehydrogenase
MRFKGKVAIVTGAGQGIGKEISQRLANEGANIVVNDLDQALLDQLIKQYALQMHPCRGDASDPSTIQNMVDTAIEKFGSLDIIVANAGITLFGEFLSYSVMDFQRLLDVNLKGSFFLVQAASRHMKSQKDGGSILLMSSVTGHQAHKNLVAYGMTKAALEMLAKALVSELSEHRININCLAPGATLTERTLSDPNYINTWSSITPMGRPCTVDDIANAVLYLTSPEAKQITGQTLVIDGGWTSISPSPY